MIVLLSEIDEAPLDLERTFEIPGLTAADGGRLVPAGVREAGVAAVVAHLAREASRQVLRARYRIHDERLMRMSDDDLAPEAVEALRRLRAHAGTDGPERPGDPADAGDLSDPDDPDGIDDPAGPRPLREIHHRLFVGELLSRAWCDRLLAELSRLRAWVAAEELPAMAPNSMNRYGVLLDDLGLRPALDWLTAEVVRPLASAVYPDLGGADLEDCHGFIVEYADDGDLHLDFHIDDSEVTLNLCLGDGFEGGELYFQGLRCMRHLQTGCSREDGFQYAHVPGQALLHAGKHRHGAHPIRAGRRVNLILWCRSTSVRSAAPEGTCPEWCRESRGR